MLTLRGFDVQRIPVSHNLASSYSVRQVATRKPRALTLQAARPSSRCSVVFAAAAEEISAAPVSADEDDRDSWPTGVARLKGTRGSPSKFRRVIDQIRGRPYDEALFLLDNLPYRACEDILATLISAASNAKNNSGAAKRNLVVEECFVDEAGHYKRFQPRAKGRPFKIQVKKSHIFIKVREYPDKYWVTTGSQKQQQEQQ